MRCQQPARNPELIGRLRAGRAGRLWNSHWPGMTSALMPEIANPGVQAGVHVVLGDLSASDRSLAHAAVVGALRGREAVVREAERGFRSGLSIVYSCSMPKSDSCFLYFFGGAGGGCAGVGRVGFTVHQHYFAHHEDVIAAANRVRERAHGLEHAVDSCRPWPGWSTSRRIPRSGSRLSLQDARVSRARRGSSSSNGAGALARFRRSRCIQP